MSSRLTAVVLAAGLVLIGHAPRALGQGYGSDTQNVLTPAAGGMAGVSLAMPQDVPAAIFGNPATLTQFHGTQFTLGGAWVEGYPTVSSSNPPLDHIPFSVTSRTQGFTNTDIGVIQDLRGRGLPAVVGVGLAGLSGLGDEYRGLAPAGSFLNNVSNEYMVLGVNSAVGVQVTDQLSVGAAMTLGTGFEQLGFIGPLVSSAMVHDYAPARDVRGHLRPERLQHDRCILPVKNGLPIPQRHSLQRHLPRPGGRSARDHRPRHREPQPDGRQPAPCRRRLS